MNRLAQVPDKIVSDQYVNRMVTGLQDFAVFEYAHNNALNVIMKGPTGSGKTSALMAYAAKNDLAFYSLPSNVGIDPTQLFGKNSPSDTEAGLFPWVDGPVTDMVRNGGVLIISDGNFLPPRIATVLFPLLDRRRLITLADHHGEVVRAHRPNGCWCDLEEEECKNRWLLIVFDMNPDYAGTQILNEALQNRFPLQLIWDYDPTVESKLVPWPTLNTIALQLRDAHRKGDVATPTSTNMLVEFVRITRETNMDFAISCFVNHFNSSDERTAVMSTFETHSYKLKMDMTPKFHARVIYKSSDTEWGKDHLLDYLIKVGVADVTLGAKG